MECMITYSRKKIPEGTLLGKSVTVIEVPKFTDALLKAMTLYPDAGADAKNGIEETVTVSTVLPYHYEESED